MAKVCDFALFKVATPPSIHLTGRLYVVRLCLHFVLLIPTLLNTNPFVLTIFSWLGSGSKCRGIWWWTRHQSPANESYPLCQDSHERWVSTLSHTQYSSDSDLDHFNFSWLRPCHVLFFPCSATDRSEFSLHCAAASIWVKKFKSGDGTDESGHLRHLRNHWRRHNVPFSLDMNVLFVYFYTWVVGWFCFVFLLSSLCSQ